MLYSELPLLFFFNLPFFKGQKGEMGTNGLPGLKGIKGNEGSKGEKGMPGKYCRSMTTYYVNSVIWEGAT